MGNFSKKLPGLYKSLWAHFSEVKNKQDSAALRQALSPKMQVTALIPLEENEEAECFSNKTSPNPSLPRRGIDRHLKKRDEFYTALTDFTNCMKVALQSASYFNDKSFENKRQHYKDTLKMFVNLRKQVREDADETVNYDEYEEDIRQLLDKHIGGVKIKEAEGAYLVGNLGKDVKPNELSEDEARNQTDKITGRITKMIKQDLADDPYAQEYFSNLLKKAIADTKAMFDAPVKQYILFANFEQEVKSRSVAGMPDEFSDNKHAQAYFGLFKHLFDSELLSAAELDDDKLTEYAFEIDKIVKTAVAEFSINPAEIENTISMKLLPMLFGDLGIENAQRFIQEILQITRLGIARA